MPWIAKCWRLSTKWIDRHSYTGMVICLTLVPRNCSTWGWELLAEKSGQHLLQPITESKNDWVQKGPLGPPSPTPSSSRATQSMLPRTTSTQPRSPHIHINYWATAGHKSLLAGLDQLWPSDPGSCLYPISNPLKLNPLHFQHPQEHTISLLAGQQCKLPLALPVHIGKGHLWPSPIDSNACNPDTQKKNTLTWHYWWGGTT